MTRIFLAFMLAMVTSAAHAATINFGPSSAGGSGPTILFNNLVTPTAILGDATFNFTVNGDLNSSNEFVDVSIDGVSLGRVFDNNTTNDPFNFASDIGNQSQSDLSGSATISNAIFAPLIADGILNLTFNFSGPVDFAGTVNKLEGSITFTEVSSVPLPASALFLLSGIFGLGVLRRRRRMLA